jgi:hypothetical protein
MCNGNESIVGFQIRSRHGADYKRKAKNRVTDMPQIFQPLLWFCFASALHCFALALLKSAGHDGPLLYPGPL